MAPLFDVGKTLGFQQRLLTDSERVKRGIGHSTLCTLCGHVVEDLAHILRDCPFAKDVWTLVLPEKLKQSCWARQYELQNGINQTNNHSSNSANSLDDTWVFLSTDGAMARDFGYATTGGVVRDHDGNWIVGFTHFLGVCSPFEAEIWGILNGILILLNKGYRRTIILTDNFEVA
ncbi:hypothetical protein CXB51_009760 [Gossypium anomalum]|uniref:RNase H type-1 domain-containing protein n=1 Tax=Gossypium anomalum TaxID=47600 RepID=A0A8J5ZC95_9ROSI|nr:hypothetical protein CXB51_009760 [Gossypium anomalum]